MMTKTSIATIASLFLIAAVPAATAHQGVSEASTPPIEEVEHDGVTYYVQAGQVWQETNGQHELGVFSHFGSEEGDTGLQKHQVCYGTFTQTEVNEWNFHKSNGHYGSEDGQSADNNELNYIPFTADAAEHFDGDASTGEDAGDAYKGISTFDEATCEDELGGTFVNADTSMAQAPSASDLV
jgi:hypothetical protein